MGALEQNCTRHIRTEVVVRTTNRDKEGPLSRLMNFTAAGYLKVDGWEVDTPLPRAAKMLSGVHYIKCRSSQCFVLKAIIVFVHFFLHPLIH